MKLFIVVQALACLGVIHQVCRAIFPSTLKRGLHGLSEHLFVNHFNNILGSKNRSGGCQSVRNLR